MRRPLRAVLGVLSFVLKAGLLLLGAVVVASLALWQTVDRQFRHSEVTVPDVRGLTVDAATQTLAGLQLGLLIESRRPHEAYEPGLISYQDPVPGSSSRRQRVVKVVVSAGQDLGTVPSLVGQSRRQATIALKSAHVALGRVVQVEALTAADTVLAQSPAPGSPLEEGGRVDLLVSAGPPRVAWVMPDLRGRPVDAARELVTMAGLRIAQEREMYDPGPTGIVRAQDPPPGARVLKDTGVTLTVTRAASPPILGRP